MKTLLTVLVEVESLSQFGWEHLAVTPEGCADEAVTFFNSYMCGRLILNTAQRQAKVVHTIVIKAEPLP